MMKFRPRYNVAVVLVSVGALLGFPAFGQTGPLNGVTRDLRMQSGRSLKPLELAQRSIKNVSVAQIINNAASEFENIAKLAINGETDPVANNLRVIVATVHKLKRVVPIQTYRDLVDRLADMSDAQKNNDAEGVALAAAEGYRTMLLAQNPGSLSAPIAVYMLNYTGLKTLALTGTNSPGWQRLSAIRDETKNYWAEISPRIERSTIRNLMDTIISGIDRAMAQQNVVELRFITKLQIDAVQLLKNAISGDYC